MPLRLHRERLMSILYLHQLCGEPTCELPEDSPELGDVSGEGDVCVQDDDLSHVCGQCLGESQLHQAVDSRIVLIRDPRHLRLQQEGEMDTFTKRKQNSVFRL